LIFTLFYTTEIFASYLLVSAARLQDVETGRAFIALGIDVNTPAGQYFKSTALYEVTIQRDINLVKLLLKAGADPNVIEPNRNISPLQEAVSRMNSSGSFRMLLETRAGVNVACEKNDLELIRMLLKAGADVNIPPDKNWFLFTLLLSAVA
jgi:ankyrin repeat protein